jgi:hypothetical protein
MNASGLVVFCRHYPHAMSKEPNPHRRSNFLLSKPNQPRRSNFLLSKPNPQPEALSGDTPSAGATPPQPNPQPEALSDDAPSAGATPPQPNPQPETLLCPTPQQLKRMQAAIRSKKYKQNSTVNVHRKRCQTLRQHPRWAQLVSLCRDERTAERLALQPGVDEALRKLQRDRK